VAPPVFQDALHGDLRFYTRAMHAEQI